MFEYLGTSGNFSLFSHGDKAVIVDTELNLITNSGSLSTLKSEFSKDSFEVPSAEVIGLVNDHFIIPNIKSVLASGDGNRMYTIPGGVQAEAKKALKWRHEAKRGGTPVGLNTARTLARGGQIGIEKVRHIAKYFPRHEVDKKAPGFNPGEDHFPSNGRIAWALWGGDAGQRWASAIVERENKKALTAGAYGIPGYEEALENYGMPANGFQDAQELSENQGPEFIARVRHDATGIDRLYMIDINAEVFVWDGGEWDSMGDVDGDIYSYDQALDDVYDNCEKTHVMIDPASAVILAARFIENDYTPVSLDDINEEEAALAAEAIENIDWSLVEYAMTAAGDTEDTKLVPKISPIDTTGILGEPRNSDRSHIAKLSVSIPALTARELKDTLTSWTVYVIQTRKNNKLQNITAAAATKELTPDNTDVPAKYLAIVSPDDLQAVMDVIAIVPSSDKTTAPTTYRRQDKQWVRDDQILADLKSATPPPVVKLDTPELLNDVLAQADGLKGVTASALALAPLWERNLVSLIASLSAAGGLDRNRGNAEKLRRYWVHGEGAAKIRWGQPGDWSRCVRHLAKYLGPRAKGYCQLRHKEATGMYTATHAAKDRYKQFSSDEFIMEEVWGENIGEPTKVTDRDLLMPLDDVFKKNADDPLYDESWTPEPEIEDMLQDDGCKEEMCNFSTVSDHSAEDPCWDGYKQIGFKDKDGRHVPNCVLASAITAAGGLDRNRGNAEQLRRYWTHGAGALKIRWGTPGDWTRCVRHLSKYLGLRAKGYCQLRHKEATGVYTGSRFNPGHKQNTFGNVEEFNTAVIEAAALAARANDARSKFALVASAGEETDIAPGSRFTIPLLVPEGVESGDGRKFKANAIDIRELPLPLLWQIQTGEGHNGSVVVGRIDKLERIPGGLGNAEGVFDNGPYGREAERLVRGGFLRGVSADLDQFEAKEDASPENAEDSGEDLGKKKMTINHARVMAATIVAKPAFQECCIELGAGAV
jgi:hypothetical protein